MLFGVDIGGHPFVCWEIILPLCLSLLILTCFASICDDEMLKIHACVYIWCGLLTCSEDPWMIHEVDFLRFSLFTCFLLCSVSPSSSVFWYSFLACTWFLIPAWRSYVRAFSEFFLVHSDSRWSGCWESTTSGSFDGIWTISRVDLTVVVWKSSLMIRDVSFVEEISLVWDREIYAKQGRYLMDATKRE